MKSKKALAKIIIWSFTAILLIGVMVTGIIFGTAGIVGGLSGSWSFGFTGSRYANPELYNTGAASISEEITNISVHWQNGTVDISVYDGDTLEITETAISEPENQLRYLVQDGRLVIRFRKSGFVWGFVRHEKKQLTVKIPQAMLDGMKSISVESVSSDLDISDLQLSGLLKLENVSGDITLTNVKASDIDVETVSGGLKGKKLTAQSADFESVSGSAELEGNVREIDGNTVSGTLRATLSVMPDQIDFESVSGGCKLYLPESGGFTATLDSVSGKLDYDFPMTQKNKRYVYGNGSSEFDFETISGNIVIRVN